jgi:predicted phage-related endonuclease
MAKITQATLAKFLKARADIEKRQEKLKEVETALFDSLKAGATVVAGLFCACIKTVERRNISWKTKFTEAVDARDGAGEGEKLAARISAATQPQTYESLEVRVAG